MPSVLAVSVNFIQELKMTKRLQRNEESLAAKEVTGIHGSDQGAAEA